MLQAGKSVLRCDGMANASFTRDEVILALDVLYSSGETQLNGSSQAMIDLCALLHKIPVISVADRPQIFRPEKGVSNQLMLFKRSYKTGVKDPNLGIVFMQVAHEYEGRHDELHQIAVAIRRNLNNFDGTFGSPVESDGFPEGSLLGHLHRVVEVRDSAKLIPRERCEICQIDTTDIYPYCPNLMAMHLTVPVTSLDGEKRYREPDFITVCPNCHAALHRRRPWLTKEHCGDLLR